VQQVCAGIFVVLLIILCGAVFGLYKKLSQIRKTTKTHLHEVEDIARLVGVLAHEIKNPLSTIKVNLRLISEQLQSPNPGESEKALRKIAVVEKETGRLEQIIEAFMRYTEKRELSLTSTDINELVSDMVDFYNPQAQSHSITIREGRYSGKLICKADADMLKQVLLNLFINAQQAMSDGGELIIKTRKQARHAVIELSDTGSGIGLAKLQHIFEPYYSSRPQGKGLGLATARKIIEAHNGTIKVESEVGKGTMFTIKLPLQD